MGTWVVQLVKQPTLDYALDGDLRVMRSSLTWAPGSAGNLL